MIAKQIPRKYRMSRGSWELDSALSCIGRIANSLIVVSAMIQNFGVSMWLVSDNIICVTM